ncbi:MAG TPA: transposase [Terriglobales bacterium]|nr:transposase [Terriglobales bacterium]
MAAPPRGNTGYSVYFITASTFQKQSLFQSERLSLPFIDTLLHYRLQKKYLLHEFVVMPNHFHLLITPTLTLERAMQLIKGGFAYRARKELGYAGEIWQPSYYDRRIRDVEEYINFKCYIRQNPVKRGLAKAPEEYPYSSAHPGFVMDAVAERLKAKFLNAI